MTILLLCLQILMGNSDRNTVVHAYFPQPVIASFIRLHPTFTRERASALRFELLGCSLHGEFCPAWSAHRIALKGHSINSRKKQSKIANLRNGLLHYVFYDLWGSKPRRKMDYKSFISTMCVFKVECQYLMGVNNMMLI